MPEPVLPLRWGRFADRVGLGLALILSGAAAAAGANAYALLLAGIGTLAHVAGWAILPATGWRRIVAAAVSTPMTWLLLAGPHFLGVLVVSYLAWLLARHRPARAWLTALFPAAGAMIAGSLFPDYSGMLAALGLMTAVLVGSAWVAAYLSAERFRAPSRRLPSPEHPADS